MKEKTHDGCNCEKCRKTFTVLKTLKGGSEEKRKCKACKDVYSWPVWPKEFGFSKITKESPIKDKVKEFVLGLLNQGHPVREVAEATGQSFGRVRALKAWQHPVLAAKRKN
jgi:hypothetical protein